MATAADTTCPACERQQRTSRELSLLLDVNRTIGRHLERDELFGALAGCLRGLLEADRFGIEFPLDGGRLQGHLLTPRSGTVAPTQPHVLPAAGTACDWVLKNRQWLVTGSREELRDRFPVTFDVMRRENMESLCAMPLETGDRCRAVLFVMAAARGAYAHLHRALIEQVAAAVAVALDNCLAHEEVRRLRDRLAAENEYLQEEIRAQHNPTEIVGRSPAFLEVLENLDRIAPTDSTVLILGETGTGKELIARALHERSPRRERPLVKVNCGAISPGLVESELFGHVKGAFTGALSAREGRFKLADRGTIFLDEVGEVPLDVQVKLLRVLQEQEFEPVGSDRPVRVNVRVIAATNRDLGHALREGRFRPDLFYRLNVLPLPLPPLRDRHGDVPLLANFFAQKCARRLGKPVPAIPEPVMEQLASYCWPGNLRELENVIERAVVLTRGGALELGADVLPSAEAGHRRVSVPSPSTGGPDSVSSTTPASLDAIERRHIEAVLAQTGWVIEGGKGAAAVLSLQPSTLRSRMKKLGIERPYR
jgi:formate hydrogenlyase transcriptional activator